MLAHVIFISVAHVDGRLMTLLVIFLPQMAEGNSLWWKVDLAISWKINFCCGMKLIFGRRLCFKVNKDGHLKYKVE